MITSDGVLEIELNVQGMTGTGGEPKVVSALEELPGVKKAFASYPEKRTVVSYDHSIVSLEKICQTLLKVGYAANSKNNDKEASAEISDKVPVNTDHKFRGFSMLLFWIYRKGYRTRLHQKRAILDHGKNRSGEEGWWLGLRKQESQRQVMFGGCPPGGG